MVIAIFGESCTGKSTIAEALKSKVSAEIFSGKDYLRLAKNEASAKKIFADMLAEHVQKSEYLIYVIAETEHMSFIPNSALRVLVTANMDVILERFAKRMHGVLPAPLGVMLEKKHGCFDDYPCDIHVIDGEKSLESVCEGILRLGK